MTSPFLENLGNPKSESAITSHESGNVPKTAADGLRDEAFAKTQSKNDVNSTASGIASHDVNYDDTSGIDRRRFYIAQPNGYSCAPTSLTEACFDFNASGGTSGISFDGSTYANWNSRMDSRQAVERAENEPQQDFGSIDEEASYAQKFGLATKLHLDPDSGVSITSQNVNQAMSELDAALAAGHGVIINVPHHFVYCAGKTADGQYIMGDPADSRTSTWNSWRMSNEMDHNYDPFNSNQQWTPTGFVEVWNPNKPVHDHVVSLLNPMQSPASDLDTVPVGQYQSKLNSNL